MSMASPEFRSESALSEDEWNQQAMIAAKKKLVRRPGMESDSVRNALALSNFQNRRAGGGKGVQSDRRPATGLCYRCGKTDHLLKDFPLPFQRQLTFAPPKGNGGKPGAARSTQMIEEENERIILQNDVTEVVDCAAEVSLTDHTDDRVHYPPPSSDEMAAVANTEIDDYAWMQSWSGEGIYMRSGISPE